MGIIAVSDVHLGYLSKNTKQSLSNKNDFDKFLENVFNMNDIDKFVVCGDFLDMWIRDMSGVVIENFINEKENVVNLGSWVKDSEVHNTYLEIKNGKMALKIFPTGEITQRRKC